jgi:hypothetical protein
LQLHSVLLVNYDMKIKPLLYLVVLLAIANLSHNALLAQDTAAGKTPQTVDTVVKAKRKISPDALKRTRLNRLKKDVALTPDEEAKAKPIVDKFVDDAQGIKNDTSLDSRTRRQHLAERRKQYDHDIDEVLTTDQREKLASIKSKRLNRLRAGRAKASAEAPQAGTQEQPAEQTE